MQSYICGLATDGRLSPSWTDNLDDHVANRGKEATEDDCFRNTNRKPKRHCERLRLLPDVVNPDRQS
jgi:hypothetical protein